MSRTTPTQREYDRALKAIAQSRQHVAMLLADVDRNEHYVLSLLGPILSNLKDAQATLENLRDNA
jgi:hypothetical protein